MNSELPEIGAADRFLIHPQCRLADARVVIVPLPYEGTVSYERGTSAAPTAIVHASHQLEDFEEEWEWEPTNELSIHSLEPILADVAELAGVDEPSVPYLDRVRTALAGLPSDAFLLGLGGEHTVTIPVVERAMPRGGTVVTIDAHPDLRDEYQGWKYSHATVMRRLLDCGYRLIQIGLGCTTSEERDLVASRSDIDQFFAYALEDEAGRAALTRRLAAIEGDVFLSIDADGLSPGIMPGVGTPMPGGLGWHACTGIVRALCSRPGAQLRGADLVEVRPLPGNPLSEFTAAKLVQKILSYRFGSERCVVR